MPTMIPPPHGHVNQLTAGGTFPNGQSSANVDCMVACGQMIVDSWTNGAIHPTATQLRGLQSDQDGGIGLNDLDEAFQNGWALGSRWSYGYRSWSQLLTLWKSGVGTVMAGRASSLGQYRATAFLGDHAIFVRGLTSGGWCIVHDPLRNASVSIPQWAVRNFYVDGHTQVGYFTGTYLAPVPPPNDPVVPDAPMEKVPTAKNLIAEIDTVRAKASTEPNFRNAGGDEHLIVGRIGAFEYSSIVKFTYDWNGVRQIIRATLVLTNKGAGTHAGITRQPNSMMHVANVNSVVNFGNQADAEGFFASGAFNAPAASPTLYRRGRIYTQTEELEEDFKVRLDVTGMVGAHAPKTIRRANGLPGGALPNYGIQLQRIPDTKQPSPEAIFAGVNHPDPSARPYIELIYFGVPQVGIVELTDPPTSIPQIAGEFFEGNYIPGRRGDRIERVGLQLYKENEDVPVWTNGVEGEPASQNMIETFHFAIPLTRVNPGNWKSGVAYEWRARVKNQRGEWTAWSHPNPGEKLNLVFGSDAPSLIISGPSGSHTTLDGVEFTATYADPNSNKLGSYRIQARSLTVPTDPDWESDLVWDTSERPASFSERRDNVIRSLWSGQALPAGDYSYRIRATDSWGAESGWVYGSFTLTVGYDPEPGVTEYLTGYNRRRPKARVIIRGIDHRVQKMKVQATAGTYKLRYGASTSAAIAWNANAAAVGAGIDTIPGLTLGIDFDVTGTWPDFTITFINNAASFFYRVNTQLLLVDKSGLSGDKARAVVRSSRKPGYQVAVIEDAANIGVSEMFNAPGEFFFTIPTRHPQISVIEPWQVHYSLERYRGQGWYPISEGMITDFDADPDEVIFYGLDYLGILGLLIDERFPPSGDPDTPAKLYPAGGGGSKYVNQKIGDIVKDQLDWAINTFNSPLGFLVRGTVAAMDETVTIFTTFKERLPFIAGLIESHRGGTGKRTRLRIRRSVDDIFTVSVIDAPGIDRDNLRFEYGGLAQGFRVVPFGDFGTKLLALGRKPDGLKLEHTVAYTPVPAGEDYEFNELRYGRIAKTQLYPDISDLNDLKRRARQYAAKLGKVGKQIGLAIRVGAIDVKDGWDITDSVLVDINRGAVNVSNYGSGFYTIWGWTWRLYPDGHDDLQLSVLPREDSVAADPSIIDAFPIHDTVEWQVQDVDPAPFTPGVPNPPARWHLNTTTGDIWEPAVYAADEFDTGGGIVHLAGDLTGEWVNTTMNLKGPQGEPGTGGGGSGDTTPPTAPTITDVTSTVTMQPDGTNVLSLRIALTHGTDAGGVFGSFVEMTAENDGADPPNPVWTSPARTFMGGDITSVDVEGVRGNTTYWLRAYTVDKANNASVRSAVVSELTGRDPEAPAMPSGLTVTGGFGGLGVHWAGSNARDLLFYELRYAPDDGTGLAPTGAWINIRARVNTMWIGNLDYEKRYWVQVRAIDRSGNVVTSAVDSTPVDYISSPDAGFTALVSGDTTKVGAEDIAVGSLTAAHIAAAGLDASILTSGQVRIGTLDEGADGLTIWNGTTLVGYWNETGLYVGKNTGGLPYDAATDAPVAPTTQDYVRITDAGITVYLAGVATSAITPEGINATAINFGSLPGGHNLVRNSSFELADFASAASVLTHTASADWTAAQVSATNITTGATALTMTAATY